jgi:hypothetical protein
LGKDFRSSKATYSIIESNTYMVRGRWPMNLKRNSCSNCRFLLTLRRLRSSKLLLEAQSWFDCKALFLRAPLGSSRSFRRRNQRGILLQLVFITKSKLSDVKEKEEDLKVGIFEEVDRINSRVKQLKHFKDRVLGNSWLM